MDNLKVKILAIIPARGGSKRIPRKNIKPFLGVPVIKYSINVALNSKVFDEVMVSTDDLEISKIATSSGATIPFMRSVTNSSDSAILADVIKEVLFEYSKIDKYFDYFCCIYPVAPLIDFQIIKKSLALLKANNLDTVLPVIAYSHPIQRALQINGEGKLEMINKECVNIRTQDLPKTFYDAGQFFVMNTKSFLKKGKIFTDNVVGIEIPQLYAQDIDNLDDWTSAEIKYQILKKRKDLKI